LEPAKAAAKRFFAEAVLGKDPAKARAEARAKAGNTLGKVIERYLEVRKPGLRPNSYRHADRYLNEYFKNLHGRPVEGVTRADVAIAVADIARVHGPVSAARARTALSACYSWALKEGIAGEVNPVAYTNDPADEKPRQRMLKPEEIRALWKTCPDTDFGRIVRLLFLTGCRRQEIGSLEWSEINFDRAMLVIPGHKMKTGREHRLPLVPEAVDLLRAIPRRANNPFVFGSPSRGFTGFSTPLVDFRACLAAPRHFR
jgi:integrase